MFSTSQQDPDPGQQERARSESPGTGPASPQPGEITIRGPRVMVRRPARRRGRRGGRRGHPLHAEAGGLPRRRVPGGGRGPGDHAAAVRVPAPAGVVRLRRRRPRPALVAPSGGSAVPRRAHPAACPTGWPQAAPGSAPLPRDDSALFAVGRVRRPRRLPRTRRRLGTQVVASPRMASQRQFVRRAPDDASVAALIDGLVRAGRQGDAWPRPPKWPASRRPHVAVTLPRSPAY